MTRRGEHFGFDVCVWRLSRPYIEWTTLKYPALEIRISCLRHLCMMHARDTGYSKTRSDGPIPASNMADKRASNAGSSAACQPELTKN